MAQTDQGMSGVNAKVELSLDGSNWFNVSGYANKVEPDGGDRKVGTAHTFDGDVPIVKGGKRESRKVTLSAVYTEDANGIYEKFDTPYRSGAAVHLRWSPGGGDVGDKQFLMSNAIISSFKHPPVDTGEASPLMVEVSLEGPDITAADIV